MLHTIPLPVMNPNIQECVHVHVCVEGGCMQVLVGLSLHIFTYFFFNYTLSEDSENENSKGFSFLNKFSLKDQRKKNI